MGDIIRFDFKYYGSTCTGVKLPTKDESTPTKKPRKKPSHNEVNFVQNPFVQWMRLQHKDIRVIKIENEGKRTPAQAARAKKSGLCAGAPDLLIMLSSGDWHALFIECKYGKGKLSENQKSFRDDALKFGFKHVTAYTFEEAKQAFQDYLKE